VTQQKQCCRRETREKRKTSCYQRKQFHSREEKGREDKREDEREDQEKEMD